MNIQIVSILVVILHNAAPQYLSFLQKKLTLLPCKTKELGFSETSENIFHPTRLHILEDGFF